VDRKQREGDQPLPTVHHDGRPDIQTLVIADVHARREVGIQRYGTALQAHNGRDALRDAYEEALDLATYLRQLIEERDRPTP
jgi:metallophosphoesterase superfamily enzyme